MGNNLDNLVNIGKGIKPFIEEHEEDFKACPMVKWFFQQLTVCIANQVKILQNEIANKFDDKFTFSDISIMMETIACWINGSEGLRKEMPGILPATLLQKLPDNIDFKMVKTTLDELKRLEVTGETITDLINIVKGLRS